MPYDSTSENLIEIISNFIFIMIFSFYFILDLLRNSLLPKQKDRFFSFPIIILLLCLTLINFLHFLSITLLNIKKMIFPKKKVISIKMNKICNLKDTKQLQKSKFTNLNTQRISFSRK